jgi:hypothetical protein
MVVAPLAVDSMAGVCRGAAPVRGRGSLCADGVVAMMTVMGVMIVSG